jgi:putative metallohydrolase (TIGR04338 family)
MSDNAGMGSWLRRLRLGREGPRKGDIDDLLALLLYGYPTELHFGWPSKTDSKGLSAVIDSLKREGYVLEDLNETAGGYDLSYRRGPVRVNKDHLIALIERRLEGMPEKIGLSFPPPSRNGVSQEAMVEAAVDAFGMWGYVIDDLRQEDTGSYTLVARLSTEVDAPHILGRPTSRNENQTRRVYAAERRALASIRPRSFSSMEEMTRYVDEVTSSDWVRTRFGKVDILVDRERRPWHDRTGAYASTAVFRLKVTFVKRKTTDMVALHEVAHCLTPRDGHGPLFARAFLDLVTQFMGAEAGAALGDAFRELKVKTVEPWYG